MARETKVEREVRESLERIKRKQEIVDAYPVNLLAALERATAHGWSIDAVNGRLEISYEKEYRDDSYDRPYIDDYTIEVSLVIVDFEDTYGLDELLRELSYKDAEVAELRRIAEVKRVALTKLSDEERKVLGV